MFDVKKINFYRLYLQKNMFFNFGNTEKVSSHKLFKTYCCAGIFSSGTHWISRHSLVSFASSLCDWINLLLFFTLICFIRHILLDFSCCSFVLVHLFQLRRTTVCVQFCFFKSSIYINLSANIRALKIKKIMIIISVDERFFRISNSKTGSNICIITLFTKLQTFRFFKYDCFTYVTVNSANGKNVSNYSNY